MFISLNKIVRFLRERAAEEPNKTQSGTGGGSGLGLRRRLTATNSCFTTTTVMFKLLGRAI